MDKTTAVLPHDLKGLKDLSKELSAKGVKDLKFEQRANFVSVIRHGEPKTPDKGADFEYDPALALEGANQAAETGDYLAHHFEESKHRFDKYIIESSPFLACLQTAG